ncbi:hypothetical protein D1007_31333 [Hordeum vulgare]|nr:hypothetical protein D1007_31333 [Hordeum vulgare]
MAAEGLGSGSGTQGQEDDTSRLLERLKLEDDEADDLVWEDGIDVEEIKPKWLALGRVLTMKNFSQSTVITEMTAAWNPAQLGCEEGSKQTSFQFNLVVWWIGRRPCIRGLGIFMVLVLLMTEYDGFTKP